MTSIVKKYAHETPAAGAGAAGGDSADIMVTACAAVDAKGGPAPPTPTVLVWSGVIISPSVVVAVSIDGVVHPKKKLLLLETNHYNSSIACQKQQLFFPTE